MCCDSHTASIHFKCAERPHSAGIAGEPDCCWLADPGAPAAAGDTGPPRPPQMSGRDSRQDPALRPQPKRHGPDCWSTPECLLNALTTEVLSGLPTGTISEPACGDGHVANAQRVVDRHVVATDLYTDGIAFSHNSAPAPGHFGVICTNPPFDRQDPFIARGLHLLDTAITRSLVLLVRNDALMTSGRIEVCNRASSMLGCCWRPRWHRHSTGHPRWAFTWVVWQADFAGPPTSRRIRRRI
jgi:hypothetical protein